MSFNYLEVAHAADEITPTLPSEVVGVELVEFPLPAPLPDLNVALRLANRKLLVFSLKAPWTGAFLLAPGLVRASRLTWASAFGKAADWNPALKGKSLESVRAVDGDRILELGFSGGVTLRLELFPARPNWALTIDGETSSWKPLSAPRSPAQARATPLERRVARGGPQASVLRDFEGPGQDWFERAYQHYLGLRQAALVSRLIQSGLSELQSKIARLIKIRGQMNESLDESARAEELRLKAEALKATLHQYPKNYRASRLDGLELDSKLSLAENADKLFARYKKLKRTKHEVELRLVGIEEQTKKLTGAIAKLRGFERSLAAGAAEGFQDIFRRLKQLFDEVGLEVPGLAPKEARLKREQKKWEKAGLRSFRSKDGLMIWVGRNHEENEELVIRMARGNDLWLHLKGRPGAHVIVQLPSGKSPSLETLLDAATIVAYYSGVKTTDKVEVDYTFRKYVKRVPGKAEKFLVTYTQNKTLMVKLEEARVNRLLSVGAAAS